MQITNCHIHTFTNDHVPVDFPSPWLRVFKHVPGLVKGLAWGARVLGQLPTAEWLDRLYRFQQEASNQSQAEILAGIRPHYPSNTRFVVLPMDMSDIGFGEVVVDLKAQHDELHELALADGNLGKVIPFATVNPLAQGSADEGLRALNDLSFQGLKLYPRMGFEPSDDILMKQVFPTVQAKNLPVLSHCSRGGVQGRYVDDYMANRYTEPDAFIPVMNAFPDLRVCLAHFGGQADWRSYARGEAPLGSDNWQVRIREMIGSGEYPNLWTDISYTLFYFDDYIPFLRLFLNGDEPHHERLRKRVLFGSDYYMTRQESLSEREICFRLRNALGEEVFHQIADENPRVWLGEKPEGN